MDIASAEFFVWQGARSFLQGWLDSFILPPAKKVSNVAQTE